MYGSEKNRCLYCTVQKRKNLTQMQLAEVLGITNQAVSKWENGRGMPDVLLLQPLCDVLGISLNEFFRESIYQRRNTKEKRRKIFPNFLKKNKLPILSL